MSIDKLRVSFILVVFALTILFYAVSSIATAGENSISKQVLIDEGDVIFDEEFNINLVETESTDGDYIINKLSQHRPASGTATRKLYDQVVYILGNMRDTRYEHRSTKKLDEDNGVYRYDCSGFLGMFVLNAVDDLKGHCKVINKNEVCNDAKGKRRPLASDFYNYAVPNQVKDNYWETIKDFKKIKPGDIIAAKYSDGWRKRDCKKRCGGNCDTCTEKDKPKPSTGHVMMAWSLPVKSTKNRDEYVLYVVDSANSGHARDTRSTAYIGNVHDHCKKDKHGVRHCGIGKGKMWFGVNRKGKAIYYRWKSYKGDKITSKGCDKNAGPLYNQQEAERECPKVCSDFGGWNRNWKTTIPNEMSVCGCQHCYKLEGISILRAE